MPPEDSTPVGAPRPNRRDLLATTMLLGTGLLSGCAAGIAGAPGDTGRNGGTGALRGEALIDDVAQRTFRFFWDTTNAANGLVPDRYPSKSFASIAAVGFALTIYPYGVEQGWVTRAQARDRTLTTLRFFWNAPQGPEAAGTAGYKGFFYHFLDMETGTRYRQNELSTIDTTLLFGGMLFAAQYFDGDDAGEAEIRDLAQRIYARADWPWIVEDKPVVSMGWHPESGFIEADWVGYNEAMLLYVLALAAPTHPLPAEAWEGWTKGYAEDWVDQYGQHFLGFAPMFGHQYSHVWIDFRGIKDAPMRAAGFDYFENSRRAALAQRGYAAANPMGWRGYDENIWGFTACDGPGGGKLPYNGELREFRDYSARGVSGNHAFDDGTIAPTAALGSIPFVPEEAKAAADAMVERYGRRLYGEYGFLDSFNPSYRFASKVAHSIVDPELGWVDQDYLGIDQGAILTMIANHRSDFVWKYMRKAPAIVTGLKRAGFTGGWLDAS
ncbi:glucoamylase family protein [Hephaestia sp. GCM10023244]|uniref:glucoamylase family protein n=1 Tax=unclassified Hephaestia TaxID=2631281 RepID=UPI002077391A|nr:glucoamylase family protein [Hephaestia sp. MAHUQ-44]MCM8730511.1 Tat pathway signal protein [Hephaestia sp. MAHUQ-44]